jgi:Ser/Thr protein kinase RdoA (MazF antagonist)
MPLESVLARHSTAYSIERPLHEVPPYEVYEVRINGTRAICKVDAHPEGDAATEGAVQQYVDRTTSVPVPSIIAIGDGYHLAEYDDGVPEQGGEPNLEEWTRLAGAGMARLHDQTRFQRTGLPTNEQGKFALEDHDSWTETVIAFLRRRRAYLADRGYADAADAAIEFFRDIPDAFPTGEEPVLCHGNWLPEHVGTTISDDSSPSAVSAVIDFEHALVAPPAYDYWRTVLPVMGDDDALERQFREGYESVRPLPSGLDRHRDRYVLVNTVSYIRSLFLQDQHEPSAAEDKAERMREGVFETIRRLESGGA